jgi:hypothetical protein
MIATEVRPRIRFARLAMLATAVVVVAVTYASFEPRIDALYVRVENDELELRSDAIALSELSRLEVERRRLARRYALRFSRNAEAVFLSELDVDARRHGVAILSSSLGATNGSAPTSPETAKMHHEALALELSGTYRGLLTTIADLSRGSQIVDVGNPSLRLDHNRVVADVPVLIADPNRIEDRAIAEHSP